MNKVLESNGKIFKGKIFKDNRIKSLIIIIAGLSGLHLGKATNIVFTPSSIFVTTSRILFLPNRLL